MISERLDQLSKPGQRIASLAATVGRAFPLDVLLASGDDSETVVVHALDDLLERRLIREQGGGAYDFAHDKIREVAYARLTEASRQMLHRRVAEGLLLVHGPAQDVVAAQIAAHFANGGVADRAAEAYGRAAQVVQRLGADREAIALVGRGLGLLETLKPGRERDELEVGLQATLGASLVATEGYGAAEVGTAFERCRELCRRLDQPLSPPMLRALAIAALAKVEIDKCYELGMQLMGVAELEDDATLRVEAHYVLGMCLHLGGDIVEACKHLEASLSLYDRERSRTHISQYSQDPAVVCLIRLSLDQWLLGRTKDSERRRSESLALAEEIGHPFSSGYALTWDAVLQCLRGDVVRARAQADAATQLGREYGLPFWMTFATTIRGWAIAQAGDIPAGLEEIERGMAAFAATGSLSFRPLQLGLLADQLGRMGAVERALETIDEALALVERTHERWNEADLYRRKGDLHALARHFDEAAAAYRHATVIARDRGMRAFEIAAARRLRVLVRDHPDLDASNDRLPKVPAT